jgi:hypothetical protein
VPEAEAAIFLPTSVLRGRSTLLVAVRSFSSSPAPLLSHS